MNDNNNNFESKSSEASESKKIAVRVTVRINHRMKGLEIFEADHIQNLEEDVCHYINNAIEMTNYANNVLSFDIENLGVDYAEN